MIRLLAIDDEPLFRKLIKSSLDANEIQVDLAENGHVGFQLAVSTRPDIVILDLHMPEWDGIKTLKALRNDGILANTPVVLLTGSIDSREVEMARELGVHDVVSKGDFSRDEFRGKVFGWLRIDPGVPHSGQHGQAMVAE